MIVLRNFLFKYLSDPILTSLTLLGTTKITGDFILYLATNQISQRIIIYCHIMDPGDDSILSRNYK